MKKILCVLLVAVMLLSVVIGCTPSKTKTEDTAASTTTDSTPAKPRQLIRKNPKSPRCLPPAISQL